MIADPMIPYDSIQVTDQMQMPISSTDRFFDAIGQTNFMLDDINDDEKGAYEDCEMINENHSLSEFKFEDLQDLTPVELETK